MLTFSSVKATFIIGTEQDYVPIPAAVAQPQTDEESDEVLQKGINRMYVFIRSVGSTHVNMRNTSFLNSEVRRAGHTTSSSSSVLDEKKDSTPSGDSDSDLSLSYMNGTKILNTVSSDFRKFMYIIFEIPNGHVMQISSRNKVICSFSTIASHDLSI